MEEQDRVKRVVIDAEAEQEKSWNGLSKFFTTMKEYGSDEKLRAVAKMYDEALVDHKDHGGSCSIDRAKDIIELNWDKGLSKEELRGIFLGLAFAVNSLEGASTMLGPLWELIDSIGVFDQIKAAIVAAAVKFREEEK